jgi:hypothetical protein
MPAKYVRPYNKGQKNDFRDAEAIAEAVQRPVVNVLVSLGDLPNGIDIDQLLLPGVTEVT